MLAAFALGALLGLGGAGASAAPPTATASPAPVAVAAGVARKAVAAPSAPVAVAASSMNVNDEARLTLTQESGAEDLSEAGRATGNLTGRVKADIIVGADLRITFTLYPRRGSSISGRGVAKIHTHGVYLSFAGTARITRGSGSYSHAHGGGQIYGVLNRETDNCTVQYIGKLLY